MSPPCGALSPNAPPATTARPTETESAPAGARAPPPGRPRPVGTASRATARREPLAATLTRRPWDIVIMDEAHRLRNARSASGRLARGLSARYLLLLTATPVENRLQDLYELVSLVAPGLLGTLVQFPAEHGSGAA